jgi:hypothetical protein
MPRLTEQEQQEIIRYIEADKPLPDKYRFLLFEDKREVELVWNGKTSEVCNIVLPFQVIEQVDEPRAEKDCSVDLGSTDGGRRPPLQQDLFDARGRQLKGWTNKLIWGDNKLILSSLKNGPLREEKDYRAFEILNLGKYERQQYIGVNPNLREAEQQKQLEEKETAFVDLILRAYRAERTDGFNTFNGKKAGRLVAVGPVNLPVTRLFVEEIILECRQKHITRVDILGFEFEMGLFPNVLDEARAEGIDIAPKYIPAEVFDKRAVEKNQVVFHDVAAIEVKVHVADGGEGRASPPRTSALGANRAEGVGAGLALPSSKGADRTQGVGAGLALPSSKGADRTQGTASRPPTKSLPSVAVELTDFSVFYSQDSIASAEATLKDKSSKIVVEKGQIVKVSKDAKGIVKREVLTTSWTDWIDYWAVDFNFESKREIVRVKRDNPVVAAVSDRRPAVGTPPLQSGDRRSTLQDLPEYEEVWTGDYIFENEWQSFRTKKDRSLELTSVFHECQPGRRKLAVKVVDIFGNDTMTIVELTVGGKRL